MMDEIKQQEQLNPEEVEKDKKGFIKWLKDRSVFPGKTCIPSHIHGHRLFLPKIIIHIEKSLEIQAI